MKIQTRVNILVAFLTFSLALQGFSANPQATHPAALIAGQTATLLPDGSSLLVGGQDATGHPLGSLYLHDMQGTEQLLASTLEYPRMWHTTTVLPDGRVLILGGIGADGQIVQRSEIFDPNSQTLRLLGSGAPTPRAFHSATLLTDGRLLIAGGVGPNGAAVLRAELWDPRQNASIAVGQLSIGRRNHYVTLLADGRVLLSGGKDAVGKEPSSDEIYDPRSQTFSSIADPQSLLSLSSGIAETTATSPEEGATEVAVTALISMRFSRPLRIETINNQTVLLYGPTGIVEAKIVGAEGGMLGFITPKQALVPGTEYSAKLSGATDTNNATAAFMQFSFTTAGETSFSDTWTPDVGWMSNRPPSKWQSMPPLEARPGITALAGQVLKLDGTPLERVTLMIGGRKAVSDHTGRFLITSIPSGHGRMMILGNTANTSTRSYGIYEVGVDIKSTITNVLRYVIWMTPLDMTHVAKIPSPTTTETIIRSPLLPGLELHIPANTVITGYDGKPVNEITITPIPLDRPPFPLPNVQVPIYFTIQPGSAYIKVMSSIGPKGARLFYPNAYASAPGTPYEFWNYDPDQKGWYVYGQGQVSGDRSQIVPNAGVEIYEFTGAMVAAEQDGFTGGFGPPPGTGGAGGDRASGGDPIDLGTGLFIFKRTDLVLPDVIPIVVDRTYRQNDSVVRAFGIGTSIAYDMFIVGDNSNSPEGYTFQDLVLADGTRIHFHRISPCTGANGYCDFSDAVYQNTSGLTGFFGAIIRRQACSPSGGWTLTTKDGTIYCFPTSDSAGTARGAALVGLRDRYGNVLLLTRDSNFNLTKITSPNGRWVQLTYQGPIVTQAQDNAGRFVNYSYDSLSRLIQVTDVTGGIWKYAYDAFNQMLSIQDPRGILYLANQYDQNGRVIRQTQADDTNFRFNYTIPSGPNTPIATNVITQTDVIDPRGIIRRVTFDANGYMQTDTHALGQPEQENISYTRDPNTNLITSMTDALSRQTTLHYDPLANLTSVTRLAGTANAITTTFTFDSAFNQLTSITDPLQNTTTLSRDGSGNLSAITDPLNHQTTLGYNGQGLLTSITDALNNITLFSYSGGDLVGITDPLQNTTTRAVDSAGRVTAVTDALNRTTRLAYNASNQVLKITDPLQGVTTFAYDPNGNLLSLTDPLNHATSWSYDNMDRVGSRTDPLQRQETFTYDPNGNLASATDRKGQVTTLQYDGLNRRTFAGFGTQGSGSNATYASTISHSYDAGNRLRQAVDSTAGAITRGYDDLDRLTSEVTPQGSITYGYDNAGRRASMTVPCGTNSPSCAQVTYTWDNANRLTQITQATSNVIITYDDANRRSSLALPNGVEVTYGYDPDSQLTGIAYNLGVNMLGNLTYTYDQVGHNTQVGGSFARTNMPQPVTSASYDVANELVSWGGTSLVYDPNGNMLSDGINAFAWNARNLLSALNGAASQYDAFARRTLSAAGRSFLYDGANAVQELSGTTVTANLLNGGLDEIFSRTDTSGTFSPLQDVLGNTIAVTDSGGSVATAYTYDPYGVTSAAGAINSNSFQYAGRDNQGNGLYYYRARYYSSLFARFVSADPIGFAGGINKYTYVDDDPMDFVDPAGMDKQNLGDCIKSNAHWYSLAGITDLTTGSIAPYLGRTGTNFSESVLGNTIAGNDVTGLALLFAGDDDNAPESLGAGISTAIGQGATRGIGNQLFIGGNSSNRFQTLFPRLGRPAQALGRSVGLTKFLEGASGILEAKAILDLGLSGALVVTCALGVN